MFLPQEVPQGHRREKGVPPTSQATAGYSRPRPKLTRWWTSCARTWTRCWTGTRSCRSWTTGLTPCKPEPPSSRAVLPSSRTSTGGKTAR